MTIKKGDKVAVHYTGTLDDGTVFDSSRKREPLVVHIGAGELISGFETAIHGMKAGEIKKITIHPKDAYGEYLKDLVKDVDRKFFPKELTLVEGLQLQLGEKEESAIVTITKITDDMVTLDANHPLAGRALNFEIEVIELL